MVEGILRVPVDLYVHWGGRITLHKRLYLVTAPKEGDWIDHTDGWAAIPVKNPIISWGSVQVRHYVHDEQSALKFTEAGFE
jgi:hypothetical protein